MRLVLFSFSLVEKLARSAAITIADNCSIPQFVSSRWSERSGVSYSSIDLLSHAAIDHCTISLLCAQYHSLKKYLVISLDADKSNLRVTRDLTFCKGRHVSECLGILFAQGEPFAWNPVCCWIIVDRVDLVKRMKGNCLEPTCSVICMVKLGWWGGSSTCLYWWSQCLSELFLDAPFPWHWQFTLRRQK